jgi:hypothetical protein
MYRPARPGWRSIPASRQEGYAQALMALGFSDEFLLQMFSEITARLTV